MERKDEKMVVQVDAYTRVCLTVIAALLTVVIIGLWADVPSASRAVAVTVPRKPSGVSKTRGEAAAAARITNTKMDQLIAIQKDVKGKLTELITLLKSGDVKVNTTKMPAHSAGGTNATGPKK